MENSDGLSKDEVAQKLKQKFHEETIETLSKIEERERKSRELNESNKSHILLAAGLSLSIYGFTQVKYELHLQTVKLNDLHDPILEPLFEFYDQYLGNTLPCGFESIQQLRRTEIRVFEASKDRLIFRQNAHFFNPVSLKDWAAFLYSQPIDGVIDQDLLKDPYFKDYNNISVSREREN